MSTTVILLGLAVAFWLTSVPLKRELRRLKHKQADKEMEMNELVELIESKRNTKNP